ncbi:2-oxo acid dehydrogenase subunit E2 [Nocardiopsis exhalans]|uniref:2-oxo acid dehydrogenase subunit E2 n=1 Tax=Nocardiopsis exhalans TaxID=163604 RepID=A0ABY5D361_9ACTN|nr:2-oxo acid dehydrogenase subunit E2 [Nocardiopsis exhalans]USY18420.1 2-oxo acid dehydrogenase subunit E2 [Nocardiopsis exhalans]
MNVSPLARQRGHTLFFLEEIRSHSPVFLDTEVDMARVLAHKEDARARGERFSVVSYVLRAAGRTLAEHPEANAAISGRIRPKVARFDQVSGKLTLDKTIGGHRAVAAIVLHGLEHAPLPEIQRHVDSARDSEPDTTPQFSSLRALHRLPLWLGRWAYRGAVRPLRKRAEVNGTFAVTSLGHRPVDGFHSVGGTTLTFGVGRVLDRPVVRAGEVGVAPVMRLNMAFDHRVIDGAEAADVLADVRQHLEEARDLDTEGPAAAAAPARRHATEDTRRKGTV